MTHLPNEGSPNYEKTDISPRGVLGALAGVAFVCVGAGWSLSHLFFVNRAGERGAPLAPAPLIATAGLTRPPVLQMNEPEDLRRDVQAQRSLLESEGQLPGGERHLSIRHAMERLSHE